MTETEEQPDDSEPTPERQAQLRVAYERNQHGGGNFRERMFAIRTRGELSWIMRDQGWSGEIDDRRASRVILCGVNFLRATLRAAHLYMAILQDSRFREADLRGAILIGASLLDTSFTGANLAEAHLTGAYLPHSNLRGVTLRGANLKHTDLSYSGLSGADLRDANLFGANLAHTDLSGANLCGADLRACRFDDQTNFTRVRINGATRYRSMRQLHDATETDQSVANPEPLRKLHWE